jgi:hypothetical protein
VGIYAAWLKPRDGYTLFSLAKDDLDGARGVV